MLDAFLDLLIDIIAGTHLFNVKPSPYPLGLELVVQAVRKYGIGVAVADEDGKVLWVALSEQYSSGLGSSTNRGCQFVRYRLAFQPTPCVRDHSINGDAEIGAEFYSASD